MLGKVGRSGGGQAKMEVQLTIADVSTNIDDNIKARIRCPSLLAQCSHELSPASDKHTDQDRHKPVIGLSDPLLCRSDRQTNSDRYHRIDRKQQAPARARSGACHHSPAESLIIILFTLRLQPYHLYYSPSPFTYIIQLLPVIHLSLTDITSAPQYHPTWRPLQTALSSKGSNPTK